LDPPSVVSPLTFSAIFSIPALPLPRELDLAILASSLGIEF
jgi:hypothetical protein